MTTLPQRPAASRPRPSSAIPSAALLRSTATSDLAAQYSPAARYKLARPARCPQSRPPGRKVRGSRDQELSRSVQVLARGCPRETRHQTGSGTAGRQPGHRLRLRATTRLERDATSHPGDRSGTPRPPGLGRGAGRRNMRHVRFARSRRAGQRLGPGPTLAPGCEDMQVPASWDRLLPEASGLALFAKTMRP